MTRVSFLHWETLAPRACQRTRLVTAAGAARRTVNATPPLVRAPISSQRSAPVNTPAPKASVAVNRPLLTGVAEFVSGPAMTVPGSFVES